ncbi:MAG: hypothetical protein B6U95_00265 [Thermofilum sp. ex4484_82]|nr:MAG: hypothetical protein B6U95_00265 [Thermofilum sp. ex4484_82]OYT40164.1 MAG: hypothetical protein B6U96_00265 [Archaeoglobales archaeon ex4484_92]
MIHYNADFRLKALFEEIGKICSKLNLDIENEAFKIARQLFERKVVGRRFSEKTIVAEAAAIIYVTCRLFG